MMADLDIAEIRAEGRKMLAKYRNADGRPTGRTVAVYVDGVQWKAKP